MMYWCVNCGEPGICTRKTTVCGACGWDGVSEWEEDEWKALCVQRDAHPVPHQPKHPVAQKRVNDKPKPAPTPQVIQGVLDLE